MIDFDKILFRNDLSDAVPRRARTKIAKLLRDRGYRIGRLGRGKDRGVNMILAAGGRRIAFFVKLHSKRAGASEIQKAEGARKEIGADEAWVFSRQGFTADGEEAAGKIGIRCLDADALWRLRRVKRAVVEIRTAPGG